MTVRVFLLFAALSCGFAQVAGTGLWDEYQVFSKGKDDPQTVAAYRAKLLAEGLSEEQSWNRIFELDALRRKIRQEAWTKGFNGLYTSDRDVFSREPNEFMVATVQALKPGRALDVSMGQGRNSLYLARTGWDVTGFDPAEEGLKAAQAEAAKLGIKIKTVKASYEEFDFGSGQWDLIVFCYAFAPLSDAGLVERVRRSLRPGGVVLIEHPMNEPSLAMHAHDRVNSLPVAFAKGFRIVFYEDTSGFSEWQQSAVNRSADKRRMVRFVARRNED